MALPIRRNVSPYSALMVVLLSGLSILAWVSTYSGMLELVEAGSGDVGLGAKIALAFAVFMLQGMIIFVLDALFSGQLRLVLYPFYIFGYMILFLISVAFAFGFYWRFLEAGSQTTQSAGASVYQVQKALQLGQSRLEQLQSTFTSLSTISKEKADTEKASGGTCPNSHAGDGPRRRLRDADAQRFQFANDLIATRTSAVKKDIDDLNADLEKVLRRDPTTIDPESHTRTAFIEGLDRKLGLVITRFNALRTEPQLRQIRDEFAARAEQRSFPDDKGGTFICPDGQLQIALNGVVRSIDSLPELQKPELRSVEGSEAVIEAFRRLSNTAISLITQGKFPPSPEQIRIEQSGTKTDPSEAGAPFSQDQAGLSERDYIPLMIAIFVDVCILLVSVNRPFGPMFNLGRDLSYARQRGPMQGVLGTFYRVFQNQFGDNARPSPLQLIAPLQDVVFDYRGEYYAAVPLDYREDNYQEWLELRKDSKSSSIFDPRNPESLRPLETSRYISAVFVALDGENIVRLQGTRSRRFKKRDDEVLSQEQVQQKLDQQGSVYAQADAFRIYGFRNRQAWADLQNAILGSTAEVEEAALRRQQKRGSRAGEDHASTNPFSQAKEIFRGNLESKKSLPREEKAKAQITDQSGGGADEEDEDKSG